MNSAPRGVTAVGLFLGFGAVMAALAGCTLIWPGTSLDRAWELNPQAHANLAPLGAAAGIGFVLLSGLITLAALGWFRRRLWGWQLVIGLISAQMAGALVHSVRGELLKGTVGMLAAGALVFYLRRPGVRAIFRRDPTGA